MFIILFKGHYCTLQEEMHFMVEDEDGNNTEPIESDNNNEVIIVSCA